MNLYLKVNKNTLITENKVTVKDIAEVSCREKSMENKVKTLALKNIDLKGAGRYVYSVLDVVSVIEATYPALNIICLGEEEFILTVEKERTSVNLILTAKTAAVCFLAFFGAAFSIMAFNNDVGITRLFQQLYRLFAGKESDGFTILEITYSLGVALGILIFFHHFARKKGRSDPTPLEVEMRSYESDIDNVIIEMDGRKKGKDN